jgi:hypothetical protein
VRFDKRKSSSTQPGTTSENEEGTTSRHGQGVLGTPMMMTLDKDFLVQLEHSFKRLAMSTERVK